jgi:membrane fusion protein, multidrug efflux system
MNSLASLRHALILLLPLAAFGQQAVDVVRVVSKRADRAVDLPGEILPWQSVAIHARVSGYLDRVVVDRASVVRQGDLLAEVSAPELDARIAESRARILTAKAEKAQADAQLAAAEITYDRLRKASATPGAVAANELTQAEKLLDAARAASQARLDVTRSAEAALQALLDLQSFTKVKAPFDGIVTERMLHPGALVKADAEPAIVVLQQLSRLRLAVAVPEQYAGSIALGAKVAFRVPAFPQQAFSGTIARPARVLDSQTRTMAVELDVANPAGTLSPGMFPTVNWPARGVQAALLVPPSSVVSTSERTFVIAVRDGRAAWVNVRKGAPAGDLIEIFGALGPADLVVVRGTDELREGTPVTPKGKT